MRLTITIATISAIIIGCGGPTLSFDCGVGPRPCGSKGLYDYDGDGYCEDVDCDEDACDINPGSAETCDGVDNDCDGFVDGMDKQLVYEGAGETFEYYVDYDGDGQCSDDKIRMCADYESYYIEVSADYNPLYTSESGDSFYICDAYGTAGQIDDAIESDPYEQHQYDVFDCCDVKGDDGCIEDIPPECAVSIRGHDECVDVC